MWQCEFEFVSFCVYVFAKGGLDCVALSSDSCLKMSLSRPLVDMEALWLQWHSALPRGGCRKVRVASPCVGVDSPARAALALQFPWVSVLIYDIEAELTPALEKLHGPAQGRGLVRTGHRKGDVTRLTKETLQQHLAEHGYKVCDGLVSGFPCPPYSSIGSSQKQHKNNERSTTSALANLEIMCALRCAQP